MELFALVFKVFLLCVCLSACATKPNVIVEERATVSERLETEKIGGRLIRFVQPGDTLYSIAFANNLDVKQLAMWNQIKDVRHVQLGQRIRLTKPVGFTEKKPNPVQLQVKAKSKIKHQTNSTIKTDHSITKDGRSNAQKTPQTTRQNKAVAPAIIVTERVDDKWLWPVKGEVVERFKLAKGQQGISVKASLGQTVMATKGGEVVYVGNALKGYGNLVIIKHGERFLSAYAHNAKINVNEGQFVTPGQKIGTTGLDNKRRQALHFQIRKDGKPVNPLSFLSKS